MDKLTLARIQALAASPDYGGRGLFLPSSVALGLSAALFLSDLSLWQGASYELTDDEIDDIKAMIAQLENDLIEAGEMYPTDRVKVTNSISQNVLPSTTTLLTFDTDVYDPEDMHSIVSNTGRLYVLNAGLHLISSHIVFAANSIGNRYLYLYKYDAEEETFTEVIHNTFPSTVGLVAASMAINVQDEAKTGDYYSVFVHQSSPVTLAIYGLIPYLDFAIVRM